MAAVPLVFVSHASEDRAYTAAVCTLLQNARDAKGNPRCGLLVDYTDLAPGKPWPKQLNEFMARCHAAVVLLTPRAVASAWVLKEATILAYRAEMEVESGPRFPLFVARAADVSDVDLERNRFGPLMLDRVQRLRQDDPAAIANEILQNLPAGELPETPFDTFVGLLADLLKTVGENTLASLARDLSLDLPPFEPDRDRQADHVREIARGLVCGNLSRADNAARYDVDRLVDRLRAADGETLLKVFRLVAPWWVDVEAAGHLAPLTPDQPRRVAVLNGQHVATYTARMYVGRAHFETSRYGIIETGGVASGDMVKHFTREICTQMRRRYNRLRDLDDDGIIADLRERQNKHYVVLPPPLPPAKILEGLTTRFPRLIFIASCGPQLIEDPSLTDVTWLRPELDLALEANRYKYFKSAEEIVENLLAQAANP